MTNNIYSDQQIQLIFEELRTMRNSLRNGIGIEKGFGLLVASIPEETRNIIFKRTEPLLKKLQSDKRKYFEMIEKEKGYTNSDTIEFVKKLYTDIYTACFTIVVDEVDKVYKYDRDGRIGVSPSTKFK